MAAPGARKAPEPHRDLEVVYVLKGSWAWDLVTRVPLNGKGSIRVLNRGSLG